MYMCISDHRDVYFEYLTILYVNFTSIKLEKKDELATTRMTKIKKIDKVWWGFGALLQILCIAGVSDSVYNYLENSSAVSTKACYMHNLVTQKLWSRNSTPVNTQQKWMTFSMVEHVQESS